MNLFKDICTIIGGVWIVDKAVKTCFTLGEMSATYRLSKKVYNGLSGDRKESE